MKKSLNAKALIIVLGVFVLAGAAAFGIYQVQSRRNAEKLLAQVRRAEAQAKAEDNAQTKTGTKETPARRAKILERYLKYRPEDTDALAQYGLILADLATSAQSAEGALVVLGRALGRDANREDVRRRALQLALDLERFPAAEEHANKLLEAHPEDAQAEAALGRAREAGGEYVAAAKLYEKAIAHDSTRIEAYTRLALLARSELDDPDRADQVIDALVEHNPESSEALLARAAYLLDRATPKDLAQAAQDAGRALALAPDDASALLVAARVAARRSEWDEARGHLDAALKKFPEGGQFYRELAAVEVQAGRPAAAEACLTRGVAALPGDLELKLLLAEQQIGLDKLESAQKLIDELTSRSYDRSLVGYLRARLQMARGDWAAAAAGLEAVTPELVRNRELARRANLLLAACYAQLGDADRQQDVYRKLLAADPGATEARALMAASLEDRGRFDEALVQYRTAAATSPEARLAVPRLLARQALQQPAGRQNWGPAEAALAEAALALPDDPRVPILRANLLVARDRADEARKVLEAARDANPDRIELWSALVELAHRDDRPEDAATLIDAAEKRLGDTAEVRLLRARDVIAGGSPDASERLGALAEGLDAFSVKERRGLIRSLAAGRSLLGDPAGALALWAPVAAEQPTELEAQLVAFDLATRASDQAAQEVILERIQAIQGDDGPEYRYGRARQRIEAARGPDGDRSGLPEARTLLAGVAGQRPDWTQVPVSLAQIEEIEDNTDAALTYYLQAVERGERSPVILRRTMQLLAESKRYDEADQLLARLRNQPALSGNVDRLASEAFAGTEDYTRALALAEQAVADGSTDPRDHLWLGQLLWAADRRAEVEAPLRQAVELAGDADPSALFALIQYLTASERPEDAAKALTEAETSTFSPEEAPLVLARAYDLIDQPDRAAVLYQQAVKANPADDTTRRGYLGHLLRRGRNREAITYLETLVPPEGEGEPAPGLDWARDALAMLLATGGEEAGGRRALALLGLADEAGSAPAGAPTDRPLDRLRAQARVLAVQPDDDRRRQAIVLLEEIARRDPAAGDDRLLLAQLHEFTGDWPQADATMKSLLAASPRNPRYRIEYVEALLRNDRADEVGPWLDQLEKLQPDAPRNVQLRAMALSAQDKAEEGIALLRTLALENADQLRPVAQVLERMGHPAAAEEMYRKYAATADPTADPRAVFVLAEFLGRQGRTREALDLCESAARTSAPEVVATACTTILTAHYDETQARRVEGWVRTMLGSAPQNTELRTALAIVQSLQDRIPEARAIYEQILAEDPENLVALNNLSWLVAQTGGDATKALELIDRAIAVGGPIPALLDTRAVAHLAANQADPAIRDLERAIATDPLPPMYFHLARAYALANRPDDARTALEDGQRLGLKVETLEPVERPAYGQLVATLGQE